MLRLALSIGLFETTTSMALIKTPSRGEHLCLPRGQWWISYNMTLSIRVIAPGGLDTPEQ